MFYFTYSMNSTGTIIVIILNNILKIYPCTFSFSQCFHYFFIDNLKKKLTGG